MSNDDQKPAAKAPGGFHYAYVIVAVCIIIMGVPLALTLSCAGIYFVPIAEYFGVAKAQVSLYMTIMGATMIVALPISERILKVVDFRYVLSVGTALLGISFFILSRATDLTVFYVVAVVLGFAITPLMYLAIPTLINNWFAVRSGFFIGLCAAFTGIGGAIFNIVGTALINSGPEGWRTGYLVFCVIILAFALPIIFVFTRTKPANKGLQPFGAEEAAATNAIGGTKTAAVDGVPAAEAFKSPVIFAIMAFAFFACMNLSAYQFFPAYCQSFGIEEITLAAGAVASACMVGQALGKIALGFISDRSITIALLFAVGVGSIGVLSLWLGGPHIATLMVGSFLFGAVYPCAAVEAPILTRAAFGLRDYANIYARVSIGGAIGTALAPVFWGVIVDLPNGFTLMFLCNFVMMAALFALGKFAISSKKNGATA